MKRTANAMMGVAGSALLLTSLGTGAATALAEETAAPEGAAAASEEVVADQGTAIQREAVVRGAFSFTQGEVDSLATIAKAVGKAASYLCGATFNGDEARSAEGWTVSVGGDVENAFVAGKEELAAEGSEHATMGCSCGGNTLGGAASVNAEVEGVSLGTILEMARPAADANTIVFTSSDGYEVALPLSYVKHHHSLLVWDVAGQPVADSMGGANQLWLGSTPAFYYSRDVVAIDIETRDEAPAAPGLAEVRDNVPNVRVTGGAEAA